MCIRDRVQTATGFNMAEAQAFGDTQPRAMPLQVLDYSAGSVSYTHLRAHETVLDLVCRLLLEKKNRNPNQYQYAHLTVDMQTHDIHTSPH